MPTSKTAQSSFQQLKNRLDGTRASRIALLAGLTREELQAVGGTDENRNTDRRADGAMPDWTRSAP